MPNAELKTLVQFFKKLDHTQTVEQFFYLLQSCLQQLEVSGEVDRLLLKLEANQLFILAGSTEIVRLSKYSTQRIDLDLIREADGRLFSYAGAAATPAGYNRLTINLLETTVSNALLQDWIQAVRKLAKDSPATKASPLQTNCFKIAKELQYRKQFFSYLRQDSAYQDLLEELLPNILQESSFQKIINSQEFIFQKAIDAFEEFLELKVSAEDAKEFLTAYENFEGSYDKFVTALGKDLSIRQLAEKIGRLISYVDGKAAGKKLWNNYQDKRTIALAVVRQNHWVAQLVRYHQDRKIEELSPNMQYAIQYLSQPQSSSAILSGKHRKAIAEQLLHQSYEQSKFDQQLLKFFSHFDITTSQPLNYNYLISSILYHPNIAELWKKTEDYPLADNYYPDEIYEAEIPYQLFPSREAIPLNQILYGPAGTGKTYLSIRMAISIVEGLPLDTILTEDADTIRNKFEYYTEKEQIALVSFHQAMSYEDFIEGIKPISKNGNVHYELENGIFKHIALKAEADPHQPYVLIIDEINRGQVAAILGELITLLEEDKRKNAPNALSTILPYSKERFSIPSNLYIIGSMNTADRGIEALDLALRRRFHFKLMEPQATLLPKDMMGIDLSRLLQTINARIQKLLGTTQTIGHAYFLGVQNLDQLNQVFEYKIVPLLMEYFYNDLNKVGLVLGKAFVEKVPNPTPFADFSQEERNEQYYSSLYQIRKFPYPISSYQSIYDPS